MKPPDKNNNNKMKDLDLLGNESVVKTLENLFMSLEPNERINIIKKLTDMDPNMVWCPIYEKEECVKYLYYDVDSIEYEFDFGEYEGDIEEEIEYDEVIDFLTNGSVETLWDIFNLDRFDKYMWSDVGFHLSQGGTRGEFWEYTITELVDMVNNHPLYISIRRDKKLEKLGI